MTPITEMSLMDLLAHGLPTFDFPELADEWKVQVERATKRRWTLAREVTVTQDIVNRAEQRADAKPEHWKEAHGELTRLRKALWESEGELLSLRFELERRVRRVRTGGGK